MGDERLCYATTVESLSCVSCAHEWTPYRMVVAVVCMLWSSDIMQKKLDSHGNLHLDGVTKSREWWRMASSGNEMAGSNSQKATCVPEWSPQGVCFAGVVQTIAITILLVGIDDWAIVTRSSPSRPFIRPAFLLSLSIALRISRSTTVVVAEQGGCFIEKVMVII